MRLTLRTLLSYLDDTLEPAQSRLIGEKVAESEIAPELIERIKKVTRRRGLHAPAVSGDRGDSTADPNTVAEYLDSALPAEQVGELEQAALDSDVALAEVASCHQILTLVLGEPAKVPPTARQHMYRIVKGKESVPYRRASTNANVAGIAAPADANEENAEADEALLLGMTGSRLLVPMASAAIIALLLIFVIWMAIPSPHPAGDPRFIAIAARPAAETKTPVPEKSAPVKIDKDVVKKPVETPKAVVDDTPKKPDKEPVKVDVVAKNEPELGPDPRIVSRPIITPPNKPDPERRAIARLVEGKNTLLLQRKRGSDDWERAAPNKDLFSGDSLLSLPGIQDQIKLDNGVRLLLWGTMPEYHGIDPLDIMESRITLHVPPLGMDADFTLESGRVFITHPPTPGQKFEPARVRVRFKEEMWDVTLLDPDTEVCFDLISYYGEGVPFSLEPNGPPPTTEVYFGLLRGHAGLKFKFREYPLMEAPVHVDWHSATQDRMEPLRISEKNLEWWSKAIKDGEVSKDLQAAAAFYANRFNNAKPDDARIDIAFFSALQDPKELPGRRLFALRALQALDAIDYFADALADDLPYIRQVAVRSALHWTSLAPDRDLSLFKTLVRKKSYTEKQAEMAMQLMHQFSRVDYAKPEIVAALFDAMKSEKVLIRELAFRQMVLWCDPTGAREAGFFDAAAPENVREAVLQKWKMSWNKRFVEKK